MDSTQYHSHLPLLPILLANILLLDMSSPSWIPAAAPGWSSCLLSPNPNPTEETLGDFPAEVTLLKTLLQLLSYCTPYSVYEVFFISPSYCLSPNHLFPLQGGPPPISRIHSCHCLFADAFLTCLDSSPTSFSSSGAVYYFLQVAGTASPSPTTTQSPFKLVLSSGQVGCPMGGLDWRLLTLSPCPGTSSNLTPAFSPLPLLP